MYLVAINIIGTNNDIIILSMILFTICPSIINSNNIHTTQQKKCYSASHKNSLNYFFISQY